MVNVLVYLKRVEVATGILTAISKLSLLMDVEPVFSTRQTEHRPLDENSPLTNL